MTRVCLKCDSKQHRRSVYLIINLFNTSVEIAPYNEATHDTPGIVVLCSGECLRKFSEQIDTKRFKLITEQLNDMSDAANQFKRPRSDSDAAHRSKRPRIDS